LTQGFAFDPWASVGAAYRHTFLTLEAQPETSYSAVDFLRLGLGGDYYPVSSFGFGPFIEIDVGAREFSVPIFYGVFQAGMRLTFDPFRAGTSFSPGLATAQR
jgi:hypothetical protein